MGEQRFPPLNGREPLPPDLEHVVCTAKKPEVVLLILSEFVGRYAPVAAKRVATLFSLLPVFQSGGTATNPQRSDLIPGNLLPGIVADLCLVSLHHSSQEAELAVSKTLVDEDVNH